MKRTESAIAEQLDEYRVKYNFSSFRLSKRIRMAISIILEGGFIVVGNTRNKTIIKK